MVVQPVASIWLTPVSLKPDQVVRVCPTIEPSCTTQVVKDESEISCVSQTASLINLTLVLELHVFAAHATDKFIYLQLMPQRKSLSICGSRRGESKNTGETEGPKSRSKKMMYRFFFENKCLDNTCPINAGVLVLSTWLIGNRTVLSLVTYTQLEPEMPCASPRNSDFPLCRLHEFCRLQPPPGFPNTA